MSQNQAKTTQMLHTFVSYIDKFKKICKLRSFLPTKTMVHKHFIFPNFKNIISAKFRSCLKTTIIWTTDSGRWTRMKRPCWCLSRLRIIYNLRRWVSLIRGLVNETRCIPHLFYCVRSALPRMCTQTAMEYLCNLIYANETSRKSICTRCMIPLFPVNVPAIYVLDE